MGYEIPKNKNIHKKNDQKGLKKWMWREKKKKYLWNPLLRRGRRVDEDWRIWSK